MASETNNLADKTAKSELIKDYEWLIRPCSVYDDEYSDCASMKGRFNQYFVHGHTIDCSQWKIDSNNCYKWEEKKDNKAAEELINSEQIRRKERLAPHYGNTVWTKRKEAPENWNSPLPEHILKSYEYSYLDIRAKEQKGEIPKQPDDICCIS